MKITIYSWSISSWWSLRPRSLVTGAPVDLPSLSTLLADQKTASTVAHVIFPRGLTSQQVLYAANRLFLPSEEDPVSESATLLARRPAHLDEQTWELVLASHVMNERTSRALAEGDREGFLSLRQQIIQQRLEDFLARMAEWDYEDTPSLDSMDFDTLDELSEPEERF